MEIATAKQHNGRGEIKKGGKKLRKGTLASWHKGDDVSICGGNRKNPAGYSS